MCSSFPMTSKKLAKFISENFFEHCLASISIYVFAILVFLISQLSPLQISSEKIAPTMLVEYNGYEVGFNGIGEEYRIKLGKIIEVNNYE